ncbi:MULTISPECIES: N-acetylmuramoyl-L-alanine amidase [unclassified Xanthomonas]|uniref:N-acetylmuramoyl-L-alanine amidase n=1 Tax=Xanthomonas sp. LMG 9002 TaxID=1591158 RepID=UPI00136F744E|nr:N-acetylmuramoyl-L-alanine amidase [Xanthomonas sp. LMG 9002]MXV07712.1 N-acetylmuramoyl-L-alanine amidase [Xanthomonas sp. LMG 9002]
MRRERGRSTKGMALSLVMASTFAVPTIAQISPQDHERTLTPEGAQVLEQIEPDLQKFVDQLERLPGQDKNISVRITPELSSSIIWVDLGPGFIPREQMDFDESLGEKVREVTEELNSYIQGEVTFLSIRARIDGKTLDELFPPIYIRDKEKKEKHSSIEYVKTKSSTTQGLVVINPGHGRYLHFLTNTWELQRPEAYAGTTDIYEDNITPLYAASLETYLTTRSREFVTSVRHTRDIFNGGIEDESRHSWADLASRYFVKSLLPDEGSTIWGRFPNGINQARFNLRHYDEDLVTRPLYANHIGAEAFISLHTNAGTPTAHGASIVTKIGDPQSVQLSKNIMCYMKEIIQALPAYSDYVIQPDLKDGASYAEIREASMPTAIVEVGFHTNTEDSTALRTSAFRLAAMKGVEKGYRTFKKGETDCRPLTITSAPPVTGAHSTRIPYSVTYSGTPSYPLYLRSEIVSCPQGYQCSQQVPQYISPGPNPGVLSGESRCTALRPVPGSVIVVNRYLEDSDGVKSPKVQSTITCT